MKEIQKEFFGACYNFCIFLTKQGIILLVTKSIFVRELDNNLKKILS